VLCYVFDVCDRKVGIQLRTLLFLNFTVCSRANIYNVSEESVTTIFAYVEDGGSMFDERLGTICQTACSHVSEERCENYQILIRVGLRRAV
jgi:hypothetical protein